MSFCNSTEIMHSYKNGPTYALYHLLSYSFTFINTYCIAGTQQEAKPPKNSWIYS